MKKITLLFVLFFCVGINTFSQVTIAVLPYKIVYEGRIPKKYTPEQIKSAINAESKSYQASMINYLTKISLKEVNTALNVKILSQGQIDALLLSNNISDKQMETLTNEQLAKILGISHVLRGSATRTFIMSDELSMGITAVFLATNSPVGYLNTTSNVNIINSIENVESSQVIFSRQFNRSTSAFMSDEQNLRDAFRYTSRRIFKELRRI